MKSHSLRGAESLSRLLQYCAKQSMEHPDDLLKEYQIAREVYGRGPDFDPQSDSCVRVQAGRLRVKLAEYYATEGSNDPVVVKLPKGGYHLVFEKKEVEADSHSETHAKPSEHALAVPARFRFALIGSLIGLFVSLIILGSLLWGRNRGDPSVAIAAQSRPGSGPLAKFWSPFTAG